jgi:Na+/H+-translocating membrane pyrophosphatase
MVSQESNHSENGFNRLAGGQSVRAGGLVVDFCGWIESESPEDRGRNVARRNWIT